MLPTVTLSDADLDGTVSGIVASDVGAILLHAGGNRSEASGRPLRDLGYGNRTPRCFVDSQSTGRDCGTLLRVRYDPIWRDWPAAAATACCPPSIQSLVYHTLIGILSNTVHIFVGGKSSGRGDK